MRDPILPIICRYHTHVSASVLPERRAEGWVHFPEHDYECAGEILHCIGWPIEMRAEELPPPLDIEFEHVATAVRGLGEG